MNNWIDDGFGNKWHRCKLGAECGLHVVRPGKAQCWCQDQESSRVEVQVAREQIAKLETDNERLRDENKAAKADRDLAGWDDYAVIAKLKSENAALREDKARLDWLDANLYTLWASGLRCNESPAVEIAARSGRFEAESIRTAIDSARKEAQP